jgi:hypothetical protein
MGKKLRLGKIFAGAIEKSGKRFEVRALLVRHGQGQSKDAVS